MERRFREIDPPLIPKVAKEIKAHRPNRRWRQRYAPTVILNVMAFSLAGSFKVICFGECLDPQMKNLPASNISVRKAKGWLELSPAENAQNYKRLFLLCSGQGEQQEDRSPAWRGQCDANGDSKWNYSPSSLHLYSVKKNEMLSIKGGGHWLKGTEVQNRLLQLSECWPSVNESKVPGLDELNLMLLTA